MNVWSHGENKVLISIHEIKKELYSVKVGVKLDGLINKTSGKVDENASATIEDLCLDINELLSQYEPYNDSLDSDVLPKCIADKTIHIRVKPTYTSTKCDVHKKFKRHLGKKRKVDKKKWSTKHLVTRKLTSLQRLVETAKRSKENNQN